MRALALALALVAVPAQAATYGPPEPAVEAPREYNYPFEIGPNDTIASLDARLEREKRTAWRDFWIGQGLAVADITMTCIALAKRDENGARRFKEANPLYGKDANCGRIAAIRGGLSAVQYLFFKKAVEDNAVGAKRDARIGWVIGFSILGWNAYQLAK